MDEGTIFKVLVFPKPWPQSRSIELFSQKQNKVTVRFVGDAKGRLGLYVSTEKYNKEYWFQPISIEGAGRALLSIVWTEEYAELRINKIEIPLDTEAPGDVCVIIKTKEERVDSAKFIANFDLSLIESEHERFFISTLLDIENKLISGSRYELIRAAGLLRQLFIDASPLVHIINKEYKIRIQFEVIDTKVSLPKTSYMFYSDLDAGQFPNAKVKIVSLDAFLKIPCLELNGTVVSVGELIRACANVKGGVHLGNPKTSEEGAVLDGDRIFKIFEEEPSLAILGGLCNISLRALKPLYVSIVNAANK